MIARASEVETPGSPYLRKYGMSAERYEALYKAQDGRCAICKELPTKTNKLGIDHNYRTTEPRGLLCASCNAGIGFFRENITALTNAIDYLQRYTNMHTSVPSADPVSG